MGSNRARRSTQQTSPDAATIPRGVKPREIARALGVSPSLIYREIALGHLPHITIGNRKVVEPHELEQYLARRRVRSRP